MDLKYNIRNITVVGHVDHGKSTLMGSLKAAAGIISQEVEGDVLASDTGLDEVEGGTTIESTNISLYYEINDFALKNYKGERQGNKYFINLIDSPGCGDLSFEVTAALRITDGALVVVDCVEGVCLQTETVLRQALGENISPVLTINKMDRCFLDLQLNGELAYQTFQRIIENVNVIMTTYEDPLLGDVQVYPEKGTVAFSSGLHGWAFTLTNFADMYASKFGVDASKMMERLWGENYFDPATKKWTRKNTGSPTCKRGFAQYCYEPIKQIISTCLNDRQKDKLWPMLQKLGVSLKSEDKDLTGMALVKCVMQTWLPVSNALLEMMIFHLPSPAVAQKFRVENLYEGPLDDIYANAIRNCDPKGPLMLYVSKMIPTHDKGRFFAFGRVFAGTVSTGLKVRIMGPNYIPGQKKDLYIKSVQRTIIWMGNKELVEDVPCGNIVAMAGLDQFITKNATLTDEKDVDAHPIRAMKFSVSPICRVAVECQVPSDVPKLVEELKILSKSDLMVECTMEETGQFVVAGTGIFHLERCLQELAEGLTERGVEIIKTDPAVSFRESVLERSCKTVMSKSPNKYNRLYMEARPLEEGLAEAIDNGHIGYRDDPDVRSKVLSEEFGWDKDLAKKIWCFGPNITGPNVVVDRCKGVHFLDEIKDSVVAGFQLGSMEGALAEESMRNICFELHGAVLDADARHRGGTQIIPTVRRLIHASQLTAKPILLEPVYLMEVLVPQQALHNTYAFFYNNRGRVFEETKRPGTSLYTVKAYLPVIEAFGYSFQLSQVTRGMALTQQCMFDHWDMLDGDPLEPDSQVATLVMDIRRRKGLSEQITPLSEVEDYGEW